jgi:gliding motility associated protien GldN
MKRLLILATIALSGAASAQIEGGPVPINSEFGVIDGVYVQEHIPTKQMPAYEFVREADVLWSKRVWRAIDMREKINHPMYFPFDSYDSENNWVRNSQRWSLWTVMKTAILQGDLIMFSPYNPYQFQLMDGDQFKYPIAPAPDKNFTDSAYRQEAFSYLGKLGAQATTPIPNIYGEDSVIYLPDGTTEYVYPPRDTFWFMSNDIVQYRLKEDWFFDKERSLLDVRILGIAPVIYDKDDGGQVTGFRELFWLYFPKCRYIFAHYFVYNEQNDAQWMSFDDLFWKRQFSSTIYKESNVFDRNIESFRTGVDALMESEKITEEIRTFEHDVWNF